VDYFNVKLAQDEIALIVVCDICSSSAIVEDLFDQGRRECYARFLEKMKHYFAEVQVQAAAHSKFALYKFTGDGWIFLFPTERNGAYVVGFMRDFTAWFKRVFAEMIQPHLDHLPTTLGVTFGVAKGSLHRLTMYGRHEYFGPGINIACWLQGAVKVKDKAPAYKALVSQ